MGSIREVLSGLRRQQSEELYGASQDEVQRRKWIMDKGVLLNGVESEHLSKLREVGKKYRIINTLNGLISAEHLHEFRPGITRAKIVEYTGSNARTETSGDERSIMQFDLADLRAYLIYDLMWDYWRYCIKNAGMGECDSSYDGMGTEYSRILVKLEETSSNQVSICVGNEEFTADNKLRPRDIESAIGRVYLDNSKSNQNLHYNWNRNGQGSD